MATNANAPYEQYGLPIANFDSTSEHIRYGIDPLSGGGGDTWVKVPLTVNGVTETKYWGRFMIDTAITTDPILEQVKLHTSRTEINGDGQVEFFDNARKPFRMSFHDRPNADSTPIDENIPVASGITVQATNNEFANGKEDAIIIAGKIPVGTDTSISLVLDVDWYINSTATGDVELEIDVVKVINGFIFDGTAAISETVSDIQTSDGTANKRHISQFVFDISDVLVGDSVIINLKRDATAGNVHDSVAGNVVIAGFNVTGHRWR